MMISYILAYIVGLLFTYYLVIYVDGRMNVHSKPDDNAGIFAVSVFWPVVLPIAIVVLFVVVVVNSKLTHILRSLGNKHRNKRTNNDGV